MARGSKSNAAQSNNPKGQKGAKGRNGADGRIALKEASARGRAKADSGDSFENPIRSPRIFDDRTKRDIAGVVTAVVAVVLFLTVALTPSGFITSALSGGLRALLGLGAYALPFILVIVGASLLLRLDRDDLPLRLGVGLVMLFLALEAILALFVSGAAENPDVVFGSAVLVARGGYVGAGIAWALLKLFGEAISIVLLAGLALAGAVIIGFSLTGALESIREKSSDFRQSRRRARDSQDVAVFGDENSNPEDAEANCNQHEFPVPARKRDERGLLAGFGLTKKQREALANENNRPETPVGELEPAARIRRPEQARVPRDLSRPRRASESLSTQLLEGRRPGQVSEVASVDAYWPSEYAFGDAVPMDLPSDAPGKGQRDSSFERENGEATRVLGETAKGGLDGCADRDASRKKPAGKSSALDATEYELPWEDAASGVASKSQAVLASGKPMTRRLGKTPTKAAKTQVLGKPKSEPADSSRFSQEGESRGGFTLPAFGLIRHTEIAAEADETELADLAQELQGTLEDFSVMATVVGWVAGPTVTLFKVDLPSGVRVSRIMSLTDDIALALAAPGVRIFAPIPGTNHVGIEVPNRTRQNVLLGDVLKDACGAPLEMAIGKDVEGHSIVVDLAKMPHLLIGGTTGSGKSVAINAMIMSILMRATPDEVRFIMIDPKRVEFTPYNGIPHLYVPVVTENKEAASALSWGVAEMERRLKVMSKAGVRNISQYNKKVEDGLLNDEDKPEDEWPKKMPYIVIIIDELADLMMNVGKEVELSISRIAQLARAAGIHMIVATQRPSTNVVTGLIKANITNRIAFNVASGIDSRVILDTPGAENLIGLGDMLFSKPEWPKPQRLQGCFVSEEEIEAVVAHLKEQGEPEYHSEILQTNVIGIGSSMPDGSGGTSSADDPLLWDAADIVVASGLGSTSNIQRKLSVGYSRAGRIMDMLEEKGVVGPPNGSKPREVLVDDMELESLKAFEARDAAEGGF